MNVPDIKSVFIRVHLWLKKQYNNWLKPKYIFGMWSKTHPEIK